MRGHLKDGDLKACDEVCGTKRGRRSKGDTWWLNVEMKEKLLRMKDVPKAMCRHSTERNKRTYRSMEIKARKAASKAMTEKAEEARTE